MRKNEKPNETTERIKCLVNEKKKENNQKVVEKYEKYWSDLDLLLDGRAGWENSNSSRWWRMSRRGVESSKIL